MLLLSSKMYQELAGEEVRRDWETLYKHWLKRRSAAVSANNRRKAALSRTGGGECEVPPLTELEEAILDACR